MKRDQRLMLFGHERICVTPKVDEGLNQGNSTCVNYNTGIRAFQKSFTKKQLSGRVEEEYTISEELLDRKRS